MNNLNSTKPFFNNRNKLEILNDNPTILQELNSYNLSETENFIEDLRYKLNDQVRLNLILKEENHEDKINEIEEFVNNYTPKVNDQLLELQEITPKLMEIIRENKILQNEKIEYEKLENRPDIKLLISQLRDIKKLKSEIKVFLDKKSI